LLDETELEKLKEVSQPRTITSLLGIAGVGKSAIAQKFVHWWSNDKELQTHRSVFWLQAETETGLRIAYLAVMEQLQIEPTPDEIDLTVTELAGRIWKSLGVLSNSKQEFLVVFDNVPEVADGDEDAREAFKAVFFPLPASNWGQVQIILTSRLFSLKGPGTPHWRRGVT
jgi:hypothetical protein